MKFRRFCTVFLLLALLLTQLWPVTAYAVEDIQLDAKAALLVDGATGTVLLDQDAHTKQYPASITKVMTALLVFEAIDRGELRLSDSITASANSVAGLPDDASTADIVAKSVTYFFTFPLSNASIRASSSTRRSRAKFRSTTPSFILSNASLLIICLVLSRRGTWMVM